jgi:hypothetical protein
MNNDEKLNICRLKRINGDKINTVLAVYGHNLRIISKHLRKLLKDFYSLTFLTQILIFYQGFMVRSMIIVTVN